MRETVKDLIDRKVVSVRRDSTVAEAALKMLEYEVRQLPVIGENGEMLGIVCASDLLKVTNGSIASAVKPAPLTMDSGISSFEAVSKMDKAGAPYAAVVDSGQLVGLITRQDVLRFFKSS